MLPKFEIFGLWAYSYPLLMGAAWGVAINFALWLNEKKQAPFKGLKVYMIGLFVFSWAGAKLFYLITADFPEKSHVVASSSFWLGGGFVFYGGLIFGLLFSLLFSLKTKQGLQKFNIFLPALALGHGIGRVGCLLAGCCYGSKTDSPFSIELWGAHRHPTQIYEALFLFTLAYIFSRSHAQSQKNAIWWYLLAYAGFRFLIEFIRGDHIRGVYALGLSTSQMVAIALIALVFLVLRGVPRFCPRS